MFLYRIVKNIDRAYDLSGTGAFKFGGRWNSRGTYMLYTSENSSLAYLESLVHFDEVDFPANLYIMQLLLDDSAPIHLLPDDQYFPDWKKVGFLGNRVIGDKIMADNQYLGLKVRSAINELEYNCLLNPTFPGYKELVRVNQVREIYVDERLIPS